VASPDPMDPSQGSADPSAGPLYRVRLTKVTSIFISTRLEEAVHVGTLQELKSLARSMQAHNLLRGWWGVPMGLVLTPVALWTNSRAMRKLRADATQGRDID
jgi:hypothetical protein